MTSSQPGPRPRVVIVGGGFAGHTAARSLAKRIGDAAEIVIINPTDYFLYLPLLPEVAAGVLDPRRITVPLAATLPGVRVVLGEVDSIDLDERRVGWTDPEGGRGELGYDRLVLAVGSVNKLLPIPGIAEHAHGFRGIPEALYLRDHVTRQIELAATTQDPREREARCTFVVVGAGYTGTEVAAQGPLFTDALVRQHTTLRGQRVRWLLLDLAERVLPELDVRLSRTADQVLRERGVEVRTGQSVEEAGHKCVRLTTGEEIPTRTLVWCVGVRPDPLVEEVGLQTKKGRLVVDAQLTVPGHPDLFACGDAAAVPDLTRPGEVTAMTAQHAVRQGKLAARNVAASLGHGTYRRYRHHDLGFVVELGGRDAAANPLHVPLSGLVAKAVTRGYHLLSMPTNRARIAADWLLDAVLPRQTVQLGLVRGPNVPLETASPELEHAAGAPRGS
jgi:NADH:ubiquinone reductase (H+-translocating)